jgi:hypothetical protein
MSRTFEPSSFRALSIDGYDYSDGRYTGHYTLRGTDPGDDIRFSEEVDFDSSLNDSPDPRLLRLLTLTSSLSYFKAAAPPSIEIAFGATEFEMTYLRELIKGGLGEFAYRNDLPVALTPAISSTADSDLVAAADDEWSAERAPLVPVGGGKDSVVTIEALRSRGFHPTLFSVNRFEPIDRCIEVSGLPSVHVARKIDPELIRANERGAHNGHIPVTAINSVLALIVADAKGLGPVVMSNEKSSNVGNVAWLDTEINHQWSKSIVYETLLRNTLHAYGFNPDRYFSLLRGLSESEIADRFASCTQYFDVFVSCNRPFALDPARRHASWCGICPKCLFVFLLMAPRLGRAKTEGIFGADLFARADNLQGFEEILGLHAHKPFECVGEYHEGAESLLRVFDQPEWRGSLVVEDLRVRRAEVETVAAHREPENAVHYVPSVYKETLGANVSA